MNLKSIIREEILNETNDVDWIKNTPTLLRIEDLVGYYFKYGEQDREYSIVGTHIPNHGGPDKLISYRWIARDVVDGRDMLGDSFIYRVKNKSYTLYDKKSNLVDPNILVYSDNTFDDEKKEVWEQKTINESDDMDWIKNVEPYVWFEDVEIGQTYKAIDFDETLLDRLSNCGEYIDTNEIEYVKVINKNLLDCQDIYCVDYCDDWEDKVCLELNFYDKDDNTIEYFWIEDRMLKLQLMITT